MSSTVFYKFLHQKNQSIVHFDGTGISVFDLKHEIIEQQQLGTGLDFNLRLYHLEQPDSEYDNDQEVIPRSSFVLARRSPAYSKLRGQNASRYVSGKPRVNRKALEKQAINSAIANTGNKPNIDESVLEEDRIKMMFENQSNAWAQTQDELSTHKMVYNRPGGGNATEDAPPPGYICYRCGGKDHWIKNCPTNTDPLFEGIKIKRTTGIPKTYLKTVAKGTIDELMNSTNEDGITKNEDGELVDKQGNTYMITDEGEYVVAVADSKTWLNYQQKHENAVMKLKREYEEKVVNKIIQDNRKEFLDPLAEGQKKKLLVAPIVMTACCKDESSLVKMENFNYHQPDLEQVLIDNDFHCPNCGKDEVLLDSLIRNEELETKLEEYLKSIEDQIGMKNPSKRSASTALGEDGLENDPKRHQINPSMPMFPPSGMGFPPVMPGMPIFPPGFMPPPIMPQPNTKPPKSMK
ncbi:uncharacterized protein KQ657_003805 [Scheffersomyces spartinae]|uniref:Protein MPE1 n=1 Tax=Scheffersomyces spartinae TaxID=45513 RepID=A0A9P7VDF2_9ASCO|nr:uncharacterized protein KQ657_003805 [Scheffersomyces spartinae]KAG7195279.1 hypothetical protein KQ657_003805 [Scheffersomyces spartinae]